MAFHLCTGCYARRKCAQDAMPGENALHSLTSTIDWLDSLIGLGGLLTRTF
jgi:hypothetical protein